MATFEPQPRPSAPRPIPQTLPYNPPSNANSYGNSYPHPLHGSYLSSANSSLPPPPGPQAPLSHPQVSELRTEHGYAPPHNVYSAAPPGPLPSSSQAHTSTAPGSGLGQSPAHGPFPPPASYPQQQSYQPPVPQAYPAQSQLHPQAPFAQPPPQSYPTRARGYSDSSAHSRSSNMSVSPHHRGYIPENCEPTSYPPGPGSRFGSTSPHRLGPPPVDASGNIDPRYSDHYGGRSRRGSRPVSGDFGAAWGAPMGRVSSHPEGRHYDNLREYDGYEQSHARRASEGNAAWDDDHRRRHDRRRRRSEERRRRKSWAEAVKEDIERKPTMGDSLMAAMRTVKKAL